MKKEKDVRAELKQSAYKIWLAGLGAFATAGQEGKSLFRNLVERGEEIEAKSKGKVDKVKGTVKDAKANVTMVLERLQDGLDEQVTAALHRLGVPTRNEIATLTERVEKLTKSIDKAKAKPAPKPRRAAPARRAKPRPTAKAEAHAEAKPVTEPK